MSRKICSDLNTRVPHTAEACPEVGSGAQMPGSDQSAAAELGLPGDSFRYDWFVCEEFGESKSNAHSPVWRWWDGAVIFVLILLASLKWQRAFLEPACERSRGKLRFVPNRNTVRSRSLVENAVNQRLVFSFPARRSKQLRTVVFVLCLLLAPDVAFAVEDLDTQYRLDSWKTEQGLPQNTVKAIHQTRDGYLWFGTRFGIVRFDGVTFRVFDRVNTKGLDSDNCIGVAEESSGNLWFATPHGVIKYKDGTFKNFALSKGEITNRVYSLCTSVQGGVWVATADGLKRLQNDTFRRYSDHDGLKTNMVTALLEDADGTLWVGTELGLQRRDPVTGEYSEAWSPGDLPDARVQCLLKDHAGNLWMGTEAAGIQRWKDGTWTRFEERDGFPENRADYISEDRDGSIWVVTGKGLLLRFRGGKFAPFGTNEGLAKEAVLCLQEDREGNLWIGTTFGGLKRMQPRWILAYSTQHGLSNPDAWSICESHTGGLWIGTSDGFNFFRNGAISKYAMDEGPHDPRVKAIFEDRAGNLWVGGVTAGLREFKDKKLIASYTQTEGLPQNQVNAIYQGREGSLWVGTLGGLSRIKDGEITSYTTMNGLLAGDVRGIREDHTGTLWIATYGGGVNRLRDGKFISPITMREGLSDNFAWCIHEDTGGVLWIGTEKGLDRVKEGRVSRFKTDQGLFDNVVNDILEDTHGNLWISCNRGIYRVSKAALNAVADGVTNHVEYVSYGISDGMLSSETNGENQPDACKTRDGRLWFPTTDGVVMIDPDRITHNDLPPPVVIEDILMDHRTLPLHQLPPLDAGRGAVLEIHYTGNSLVAPEKVRFRYRLDGFDKDWISAETRRVAYYTNLRPGNYTFRVIACNNHGVWNSRGDTFAFFLPPHFYQTWLFYVMCGLVVIVVGYGMHWIRLRVVRKIERLERRHALEKERARIASEMHDDLGSSLTQIALLSELTNRDLPNTERAGEHIRKILATTRAVFRAMDEIVWAINPKHDTLSSLVGYLSNYAQEFLRPAGVRCRLDLPAELPPFPLTTEARHNLFLTVKEALNNIAKHAAASEVWLRATLDTDRCSISIEDNGRGFLVAAARPDGNGLRNMKDRLAAIGGEFRLDSRPGGGTKLELFVPLKRPLEKQRNTRTEN